MSLVLNAGKIDPMSSCFLYLLPSLSQVPSFSIAPFLLVNLLLKTTNLLGCIAQNKIVNDSDTMMPRVCS